MRKLIFFGILPLLFGCSTYMSGTKGRDPAQVNSESPIIKKVSVPENILPAGAAFDVIVQVADFGLGISPVDVRNFNTGFRWENDPNITLSLVGPKHLGGENYSYRVEVNNYRPGGRYTLSKFSCVYMKDRAENSTCAQVPNAVSVIVANNSPHVDSSPPQIIEAFVVKSESVAGQNFEVRIRVADVGLGVSPGDVGNFNSSFRWENDPNSTLSLVGPKSLGEDTYGYRVEVDKRRPSGRYILNQSACVYMKDRAGNGLCTDLPTPLEIQIK